MTGTSRRHQGTYFLEVVAPSEMMALSIEPDTAVWNWPTKTIFPEQIYPCYRIYLTCFGLNTDVCYWESAKEVLSTEKGRKIAIQLPSEGSICVGFLYHFSI